MHAIKHLSNTHYWAIVFAERQTKSLRDKMGKMTKRMSKIETYCKNSHELLAETVRVNKAIATEKLLTENVTQVACKQAWMRNHSSN